MRNVSLASDITSRGANQAQAMRQAEQEKARYEAQQRKEQAQAFNQSVQSLIAGIGVAYDLGEKTDWSWSGGSDDSSSVWGSDDTMDDVMDTEDKNFYGTDFDQAIDDDGEWIFDKEYYL